MHLSVILKLTVMFFSTGMCVQEMSYLCDRPSCNVHPQNTYMSLCVCAHLSAVTSGLSLVKFDIAFCQCRTFQIVYFMVGVRFEVVTSVLLKIQILSEVTLCHWASSSWF